MFSKVMQKHIFLQIYTHTYVYIYKHIVLLPSKYNSFVDSYKCMYEYAVGYRTTRV